MEFSLKYISHWFLSEFINKSNDFSDFKRVFHLFSGNLHKTSDKKVWKTGKLFKIFKCFEFSTNFDKNCENFPQLCQKFH